MKKFKSVLIWLAAIIVLSLVFGNADSSDSEKTTVDKTEISSSMEDDVVDEVVINTSTPTEEPLPTVTSVPEVTTTVAPSTTEAPTKETVGKKITLADIPAYAGKAYVIINNNEPLFTKEDMTTTSYEFYSDLDSLGRCGMCIASVGVDIMPTEDRGEIGNVKPSGWVQEKYGDLIDGNYLYNRCHLIGYQLTGENANVKNLITGTRSFNVDAMLPFENMVADYVKETENHVMYRVTPMFDGDNLVATGVLMEAKSVEDDGEEILFCVFCYNVQPGVAINYATGESRVDNSTPSKPEATLVPTATPKPTPEPEATLSNNQASTTYVWKSATGSKYHSVNDCGNMNPNKAIQITLEEAEAQNLGRCSKCY